MDLLDKLKSVDAWKKQGHDVFEQFFQIDVQVNRKKRKQAETREDRPKSSSEKVIIRLHLSPERVEKTLGFLERHERLIRSHGLLIKGRYERGIEMLAELLYEDMVKETKQGEGDIPPGLP